MAKSYQGQVRGSGRPGHPTRGQGWSPGSVEGRESRVHVFSPTTLRNTGQRSELQEGAAHPRTSLIEHRLLLVCLHEHISSLCVILYLSLPKLYP